VALVQKKYGFPKPPDMSEVATKGIKFESGSAAIGNRRINITSLGVYNDGFIVVTRDTRDSKSIMDDMIDWLVGELKFRNPVSDPMDQYGSHVIVEFESEIDEALAVLEPIKAAYQKVLTELYGFKAKPDLQRIGIALDPSFLPRPDRITTFGMDRRSGVAHSQNRWFCNAPLPTEVHLDLLKTFESSLREPKRKRSN
jgi:hypothetical protein